MKQVIRTPDSALPNLEALRRAHVRLQVALRPSTKQHLVRLGHDARLHGFEVVWVPNIQEAGQPTAPGLNKGHPKQSPGPSSPILLSLFCSGTGRSFLQSRTLGATRCALCSLRCLRCALQRFPPLQQAGTRGEGKTDGLERCAALRLLVERTPLVMVPVLGPPGFLRLLLEALATLQSLTKK